MRLQAFKELWRKYRAVWSLAWQHRHQMQPKPLQPHEAEFLPAALALQETPMSPAPRLAQWLIIGFFMLALLWALFGKIDVVATAQGKIVPNDRTKTIQPLEPAAVKAIYVKDGQPVKRGQVLIELDATTTQADQDRVQGELLAAQLQVARGQALLQALQSGKPPLLVKPKEPVSPQADDMVRESQQQLQGIYAEYMAKRSRIEAEAGERQAQAQSIQESVRKLEQSLPITRQRANDYKNLVEKNFVSQHGYLEKEQARIEQEGELALQRSRLKEMGAALQSTRTQVMTVMSETRRASLDSITEGQQKVAALQQELLKAQQRGRMTRITSPVDGTVQQLAVHTVGGVVTAAQPLMVIVPRDNSVEIEAFIENKDIGFVRPGQVAEIKVETFQYTKYGTLPAELITVSVDAINDEKRGLIYSSRVKMKKSTLKVGGAAVQLSPGMAVTVEIKTGKRRLIEYFLGPLLQAKDESLRER
jgi:hemolysin D